MSYGRELYQFGIVLDDRQTIWMNGTLPLTEQEAKDELIKRSGQFKMHPDSHQMVGGHTNSGTSRGFFMIPNHRISYLVLEIVK